MRCHPYGIALYHPQPRATFHPGMVGYFDAYGNWNHITDLSQVRSSADTALAPPADLPALAQPEQQTWGPKLGSSTRGRRVELSAGISETVLAAAGAPLSLGSCFRFESERASGAVLVTSDPVVHERFYHESPFKRWVVSNARRLLGEREELKEYELWVVTSTWSAREAAVNCWRDQKKAVEVGFKVGFVEIGEVAPKGDWVDRGAAEGWIRVKGDEEDRRVVFFGGLRFRYRPLIGVSC
ncbi:hypothetical protein N7470_007536 [Penicillium chermesinum]|nr:hypothetical protein N7470_007536 [Penicillium chermesinum]